MYLPPHFEEALVDELHRVIDGCHVPTWNSQVVHAHGTIWVHDDEAFIRGASRA